MKTLFISPLLSIILYTASALAADDVRSKVTGPNRASLSSLEIDPDSQIYGVPFGASEDDLMKAFGKPSGYVRLNDAYTALIYGRSHAFLFESGKLKGIRITGQILDWKLSNDLQEWSSFDNRDWRLNSGVFMGMSLKEIRKILKDKLASDQFGRHYYLTAKGRVELEFAQYRNSGPGDEAYILHGIYVVHGMPVEGRGNLPGFGHGFGLNASGAFGGIGALLREDNNTGEIEITSVTRDGPAARAGLQKGLFIHSVDDVPVLGKGLPDVVEMLRGKIGTKVKLDVFEPDKNASRVVELMREEVNFAQYESMRGRTNLTVMTDQVLRLEAANGARAAIQFFGFTKGGSLGGAGDGEDTATYRWRYRVSPEAPVAIGTNTAVYRYTSKLVGSNRYQLTPRGGPEDVNVKVGEFEVEWSYGYTNKGFIYCNPAKITATVNDRSEFENGP